MATIASDIKDAGRAAEGQDRMDWAAREMPVLRSIQERFSKEKPLEGMRIAACLHVTTETSNLILTLKEGGAQVALCASNPLSTQDDVAASLVVNHGIPVFAVRGEDDDLYYQHLNSALDLKPHITLDDGADLVATVHRDRTELLDGMVGGMEETTTGVIRLRSMAADGKLLYPVISVNEADTKHMFDNRYGTGQSTIDGIIRATNVLFAGKTMVVSGYGWCGRGIASRSRGLGARVVVVEVDPIKALEAVMDGYQVMPMMDAAKIGDIFVTVTGGYRAIDTHHLAVIKDGALVANSGHFNVEINIEALEELSVGQRDIRGVVREYTFADGRRVNLLAEGRLINLAAAEGHPASVMDMSFANQALCAEYMVKSAGSLGPGVHPVPREIDQQVGRLKLLSMGIQIDELTEEQVKYANSWESGT